MKTKLLFAVLSAFFVINQNALANGNSVTQGDQDFEKHINSGDYTLVNKQNYLPYLQVGGAHFFRVDDSKAALGTDLFVPLWQQPTHLFFTHLRVYDRTGAPFEGNAHLGYRYLVPELDHMYGMYGAFDRNKSQYGNYFNQLTFGVEGWFQKLFVGGNYYHPIGEGTRFIGITDEEAVLDPTTRSIWFTANKQEEKVMGGGDAEFGYEIVRGLIAYAGAYYFTADGVEDIRGPKARVTYDWSLENGKRIAGIIDKVGLEVGGQNDRRGTKYYIGANIRMGLLPNRSSDLEGAARHMIDLVRRDADIISGSSTKQIKHVHDLSVQSIPVIADIDPDDGGSDSSPADHGPLLMTSKPKTPSLAVNSPFTGKLLKLSVKPTEAHSDGAVQNNPSTAPVAEVTDSVSPVVVEEVVKEDPIVEHTDSQQNVEDQIIEDNQTNLDNQIDLDSQNSLDNQDDNDAVNQGQSLVGKTFGFLKDVAIRTRSPGMHHGVNLIKSASNTVKARRVAAEQKPVEVNDQVESTSVEEAVNVNQDRSSNRGFNRISGAGAVHASGIINSISSKLNAPRDVKVSDAKKEVNVASNSSGFAKRMFSRAGKLVSSSVNVLGRMSGPGTQHASLLFSH